MALDAKSRQVWRILKAFLFSQDIQILNFSQVNIFSLGCFLFWSLYNSDLNKDIKATKFPYIRSIHHKPNQPKNYLHQLEPDIFQGLVRV